MEDTYTFVLGIIIVIIFFWRFVRTRQLFLTSLRVQTLGLQPITFNRCNFVQHALLGRRSIKPNSFFIRAFVFALVALCLIPFKDYEPILFWLIITMIILYVSWCVAHGVLLKKKTH